MDVKQEAESEDEKMDVEVSGVCFCGCVFKFVHFLSSRGF